MDVRKIQKTGDMHYLYLPTKWCKNNKINSDSTVNLKQNWDGELVISPGLSEKKLPKIELSLSTNDQNIINKVLVACYINPLKSFSLNLEKNMDFPSMLGQTNLISLESVEFDKKRISGQSAISIADALTLLKTMVMKVKNMFIIMQKNYDIELINRYEEEIDKSKMYIDKAIIGSLTNSYPSKGMKGIDLYYVSWISRDLERMVDHLININKNQQKFFKSIVEVINYLKKILEKIDSKSKRIKYTEAIEFINKVNEIEEINVKDVLTYDKRRVKRILYSISEVLMDWSITNEVE